MARADFTEDAYDVDEIYTGSQDNHGHSANFRCAVPKQWNGAIQALIQSDEWEYRTVQEFVRDAVYHRLRWTTQTSRQSLPHVRSAVAIAAAQQKMNRLNQDREDAEALEANMQQIFREAMRVGDAHEMRNVINEFQDVIDHSVREPFRSRLLETLRFWEKSVANA